MLEFTENCVCQIQKEIHSAHWHHQQQATYYSCQDCQEVVTESLVFLSEDKKHDHYAVAHFANVANKHLQLVRYVDMEIHFTDGPKTNQSVVFVFTNIGV